MGSGKLSDDAPKSQELLFVRTVVDCLLNHQYPQLITVLKVLANDLPADKKRKALKHLEEIPQRTTIAFAKLCFYYVRSFDRDPKRGVRFMEGRISYGDVRGIMQEEVIDPLTELSIEILTGRGSKLDAVLAAFSSNSVRVKPSKAKGALDL